MMARLDVRHGDGRVEQFALSPTRPCSIGRQSFNDIAVAGNDVASFHCRVAWNGAGYEISSATTTGIELNGTAVQTRVLRNGDTIRVGDADLVFKMDEQAEPDAAGKTPKPGAAGGANTFQTSPTRTPARGTPIAKSPGDSGRLPRVPAKSKDTKDRDSSRPAPEDLSMFSGEVLTESAAERAAFAEDSLEDIDVDEEQSLLDLPSRPSGGRRRHAPPAPSTRQRDWNRSVRPGEQDIFRSPLVLSLGGGGLALLLFTLTIWFLMARQSAFRLYDRAVADMNDGKFAQAIAGFEEFAVQYPGHKLHRDALLGAGKAKIRREILGATPAWKRGLTQLETFIEEHRKETDFRELQPGICGFAKEIAEGSARTAESTKEEELLQVSASATQVLERYSEANKPPVETLDKIRELTEKARAAILKQRTLDAMLEASRAFLANKQPIPALAERDRLLRRYPDFVNHSQVREILQQALSIERSLLIPEELDQPAVTEDPLAQAPRPFVPLYLARSRTDETSQGRQVLAYVKEAVTAVDTVTGEPLWRRIIGADSPFFPVVAPGSKPGYLMYDRRSQALLYCLTQTGELVWRQPLPMPHGGPTIHEGQLYLATEGKSIYRIDLETGRISARVQFSQEVFGPPVVSHDREHLFVVGHESVFYALSVRPLEPVTLTFTDHRAGTIQAPPTALGHLLLLCENDRLGGSRLRVWDARVARDPLPDVANYPLPGTVVDRPILRGTQLIVPVGGSRLYGFNVNDDQGQTALALVGEYRIAESYDGPMSLGIGPDGQFWVHSGGFRRFQLGAGSIKGDKPVVGEGIPTQPLQAVADAFYLGRRPLYSDGAIFSLVDRERMVMPWRLGIGARPLAITAARGEGCLTINAQGEALVVTKDRLLQRGMEWRAATEIEWTPGMEEPPRGGVLNDGRAYVAANQLPATFWLFNSQGMVESKTQLPEVLTGAPITLGAGIVLPLANRLKYLPNPNGPLRVVQDWVVPAGDQGEPRWVSLHPLTDREFVVVEGRGELIRLQLRAGDTPHFAETARTALPNPVDVPAVFLDGQIAILDALGELRLFNATTFDRVAETTVPDARGLSAAGGKLFVDHQAGGLSCFTPTHEIHSTWTSRLTDLQALGSPIAAGKLLWIATQEGVVLALDPTTGTEQRRVVLPQQLAMGLQTVADQLVAVATDGALYVINRDGAAEDVIHQEGFPAEDETMPSDDDDSPSEEEQ